MCCMFPGAAGGSASAGARLSEGHQNRAEELADTQSTPGLNLPGGGWVVQPCVSEQGS